MTVDERTLAILAGLGLLAFGVLLWYVLLWCSWR